MTIDIVTAACTALGGLKHTIADAEQRLVGCMTRCGYEAGTIFQNGLGSGSCICMPRRCW